MKKQELFDIFRMLFPNWVDNGQVKKYKKIGPNALVITFETGLKEDVTRVFLYNSGDDWQFGTKLWRNKPKRRTANNKGGD